jgi:hypothetical protein
MPLVSSLDQTPWRSGSPQGVRGGEYGVGGPALYAVITNGGADVDAPWATTGKDAISATMAAAADEARTRVNMS